MPEQENRLDTSPHINRFLAREPPDGCEKVNSFTTMNCPGQSPCQMSASAVMTSLPTKIKDIKVRRFRSYSLCKHTLMPD